VYALDPIGEFAHSAVDKLEQGTFRDEVANLTYEMVRQGRLQMTNRSIGKLHKPTSFHC
jgi:hypothetical protein